MSRLAGRIALVTGAASGIGKGIAIAFAREGADLVIADRAAEADAAEVIAGVREQGREALFVRTDVSDERSVQAMAEAALARFGRVDILVNNAGILRDKSFAKMDLADFRLVLDVHLMGAVHCCKAVWEIMRAQNHGRIVMTTSSSGLCAESPPVPTISTNRLS